MITYIAAISDVSRFWSALGRSVSRGLIDKVVRFRQFLRDHNIDRDLDITAGSVRSAEDIS